jgi:hypothetical protein
MKEAEQLKLPFSPEVGDILRKMLTPVAAKRPTLLELQSHPFLAQMPKVSTNLVPRPIVFYRVAKGEAVRKFRRPSEAVNAEVLAKCVAFESFDADRIAEDLAEGRLNRSTAIYSIMKHPLFTRPVIPLKLPKLTAERRVSASRSGIRERLKPVKTARGTGRMVASSSRPYVTTGLGRRL